MTARGYPFSAFLATWVTPRQSPNPLRAPRRYMESHELGLLPVVAETLKLSTEEVERIKACRRAGGFLARFVG